MIIKFKTYESINEDEPELGDYVICKESHEHEIVVQNFLSQNIGKIVEMNKGYKYIVKYKNIPNDTKKYFIYQGTRGMDRNEIKYWSKDKEELESILNANKYNL